MPIYWIDSGVLITAKNRHYRFDLVPKFWTFLHGQLQAGTIRMPRVSFQEIMDGNDDLAKWCKHRKDIASICVNENRGVQNRYGTIAEYVSTKYKMHQVAEFLRGADGWVIAHALETHGFVVTEESIHHNKSKIKIPTVCKAMHAPWKNPFDMCSELGGRFS